MKKGKGTHPDLNTGLFIANRALWARTVSPSARMNSTSESTPELFTAFSKSVRRVFGLTDIISGLQGLAVVRKKGK